MLMLHQLQRVRSGSLSSFEATVRDDWLPAVRSVDGARLAWYGSSTAVSRFGDEVAIIIALRDAASVAAFGAAVRTGALAPVAAKLASMRLSVETRLMRPIDYDPWALEIESIPEAIQEGPSRTYMHDFVPPVAGQMRGYVDMMRERYMALTEKALSGVVLRASWQTVSGGGPLPEMFNLSEIRSLDALVQLIAFEVPREYKQMGTWMWEALATRDRWTTRLLRSATWSPVK